MNKRLESLLNSLDPTKDFDKGDMFEMFYTSSRKFGVGYAVAEYSSEVLKHVLRGGAYGFLTGLGAYSLDDTQILFSEFMVLGAAVDTARYCLGSCFVPYFKGKRLS